MENTADNSTRKDAFNALKGMQSVRATFTLPRQAIDMISAVANQLGVKQKSIFDHLVENRQVLKKLANQAQGQSLNRRKRKQKTFVLSRHSLDTLDTIARKYKTPRDLLVEHSIHQLRPLMDAEKQKHENRKALLGQVNGLSKEAKRLADTAEKLMGTDDAACADLTAVADLCDKTVTELKSAIERGRCMETL